MGDMTSSRMVGCLFSQLTEGQVEWAPLVPELDVVCTASYILLLDLLSKTISKLLF